MGSGLRSVTVHPTTPKAMVKREGDPDSEVDHEDTDPK